MNVPVHITQPRLQRVVMVMASVALLASAFPAHAVRLEVSPDSHWSAHIGAAVILAMHIAGGAIGLVSGSIASFTRKGSKKHRLAGKIFLISMFVAYLIGAGVAPFLAEGQRPNFVGGVLALYLLLSGVSTARRRQFVAGRQEQVGLGVALAIMGMGIWFAIEGANSPTGTVDGSPPQAFVLFITAGLIAASEEAYILYKGTLTEIGRQSRHLWRMCFSFFLASGSLFLGQPQVFPDGFSGSAPSLLLAFAPLFVMVTWLILVRVKPIHR